MREENRVRVEDSHEPFGSNSQGGSAEELGGLQIVVGSPQGGQEGIGRSQWQLLESNIYLCFFGMFGIISGVALLTAGAVGENPKSELLYAGGSILALSGVATNYACRKLLSEEAHNNGSHAERESNRRAQQQGAQQEGVGVGVA